MIKNNKNDVELKHKQFYLQSFLQKLRSTKKRATGVLYFPDGRKGLINLVSAKSFVHNSVFILRTISNWGTLWTIIYGLSLRVRISRATNDHNIIQIRNGTMTISRSDKISSLCPCVIFKLSNTGVGYMEMHGGSFDSHYSSTGLCKSIQPNSVVDKYTPPPLYPPIMKTESIDDVVAYHPILIKSYQMEEIVLQGEFIRT